MWISTKDKLPEARYGPKGEPPITSDDVLIIYESGEISIGSYDTTGDWYDNQLEGDPMTDPTHWMPLPASPMPSAGGEG